MNFSTFEDDTDFLSFLNNDSMDLDNVSNEPSQGHNDSPSHQLSRTEEGGGKEMQNLESDFLSGLVELMPSADTTVDVQMDAINQSFADSGAHDTASSVEKGTVEEPPAEMEEGQLFDSEEEKMLAELRQARCIASKESRAAWKMQKRVLNGKPPVEPNPVNNPHAKRPVHNVDPNPTYIAVKVDSSSSSRTRKKRREWRNERGSNAELTDGEEEEDDEDEDDFLEKALKEEKTAAAAGSSDEREIKILQVNRQNLLNPNNPLYDPTLKPKRYDIFDPLYPFIMFPDDVESKAVFVGNLPDTFMELQILKMLRELSVADPGQLHLKRSPEGKPMKLVYLEFESVDDARNCVSKVNGKVVALSTLICRFTKDFVGLDPFVVHSTIGVRNDHLSEAQRRKRTRDALNKRHRREEGMRNNFHHMNNNNFGGVPNNMMPYTHSAFKGFNHPSMMMPNMNLLMQAFSQYPFLGDMMMQQQMMAMNSLMLQSAPAAASQVNQTVSPASIMEPNFNYYPPNQYKSTDPQHSFNQLYHHNTANKRQSLEKAPLPSSSSTVQSTLLNAPPTISAGSLASKPKFLVKPPPPIKSGEASKKAPNHHHHPTTCFQPQKVRATTKLQPPIAPITYLEESSSASSCNDRMHRFKRIRPKVSDLPPVSRKVTTPLPDPRLKAMAETAVKKPPIISIPRVSRRKEGRQSCSPVLSACGGGSPLLGSPILGSRAPLVIHTTLNEPMSPIIVKRTYYEAESSPVLNCSYDEQPVPPFALDHDDDVGSENFYIDLPQFSLRKI